MFDGVPLGRRDALGGPGSFTSLPRASTTVIGPVLPVAAALLVGASVVPQPARRNVVAEEQPGDPHASPVSMGQTDAVRAPVSSKRPTARVWIRPPGCGRHNSDAPTWAGIRRIHRAGRRIPVPAWVRGR
ncbi:hypothetical protein [Amycolatopsis mediterranei]|uniref:hypothetical protein n=1 Tax=Amycolatopsis mediterranei TaxID=33910 RepID=UPI0004126E43|nr:hypothetical protein [Amycolatopsis mediterranei]UZF72531.1 hypothetical protein ISP_005897 [Amycolatopsis mediterranei]